MTDMAVDADCLASCIKVWKGELKYVLCDLNSGKTAIVATKTSTDANYDNFLAECSSDQCQWALYSLEWETASGDEGCVVHLVRTFCALDMWSPDDAKIKQKMVFSAARGSFHTKLTNNAVVNFPISATESSDLARDNVIAKL